MSIGSWAGVREQIEELAKAPGANAVFGFSGHEFALEDPLGEREVDQLEAQLGVRLPEDYRAFLTEVGAGGAGPGYGLFPVRRAGDRWSWEGDGADLADPGRLSEPFPAQGPDPALLDALQEECPQEEDFDEEDAFDEAQAEWDSRWEDLMWSPERTVGALVLSHSGCAYRQWLVVSGPERGRIWSDDRADDRDLEPLLGAEQEPMTFTPWYRKWLADAVSTVEAAR
ncbi:SMI1/KNR4 family protein [Kitasatospora purpeofusca]|uniref:SMI1/KNR4 family protein n=1 Tax=Kitasatospora purpeofusca TaxID=67352 RepID=UPI0022598E1B|nr:SMI1/KNR4 family protein [Kitasatospora purpeofusca]MCX4684308.1 SMI1/KNR4 family protein [Kitasatospora purpeofusca]